MPAWTQKPPSGRSGPVARPKTGETSIQHVRIPDEDWDEFKGVAGRHGPSLIRQFIRWYLRKPGATLPKRPSTSRAGEASGAEEGK